MANILAYINDIAQKVKPVDIIDIGFIASFIYFVLIGVRRTRVRFIFTGIVFVGLVYIAARILGLYLTTIALQAFFTVFIVVMVIIFQDELRHLFERLALLGMLRNRETKKNIPFNDCAEMLTSAVAALSRKRTGALLVIKGNEPIERYIEAGKEFDALLSQEIVEGIFHTETPTHDGAIIIVGERIVKFGCHLPLSTNVGEVGRSGTRHAAGVGLSERTDALSLIVSEETGEISVAENGHLTSAKDLVQLKVRLLNFYVKRFVSPKKEGLLNMITSHSLEKVMASFLALGLWLAFAHPGEMVRRYFIVPVEYRNLGTDIVIKEPKLKEVTVTLSGTEQKFNLLNPKVLKFSLDAEQIRSGENKITLSNDLLKGLAGGVSIVDIEPDQVVLNVHRLLPVSIPIRVATKGRLSASLVMKEIKVAPKQAEALLPSTISREGLSIDTEPIDLGAINETIVVKPSLIVPGVIRFKDNKHPDVTVTVEVGKKDNGQ